MRTPATALVALALSTGCQLTNDSLHQQLALSATACPLDSGPCVPTSPPTSDADVCLDDRWVAILKGQGACPEPSTSTGGRWNASPLFKYSAPWLVPPSLRPFCLYRWEPLHVGNPPDLVSLGHLDERFVRRERDCAAVKGAGESLAIQTSWRSLRDQFYAQAGRTSLPANGQSIRVAVIDAAPTQLLPGPVAPDRSGHGETVGQVINALNCPSDGGVCPTKVVTHLALPLVALGNEDEVHGGRFGYQSQIASAVFEAVAAWRLSNSLGGTDRRLVLNMSLGWEPAFGGDYTSLSDLPAPVRAVHSALLHARCQGALPVVAAGNDTGGSPAPFGPLYPGAWETKAAPEPALCSALEGATYSPAGLITAPTPTDYQPLVFSVSGVRGDGVPLMNARKGGHARLVAPGAHVTVPSATNGPTAGMTGSSISAAVVTASVAAAWSYRPELNASTVMSLVWAGSTPQGGAPDYCLGGQPCPISPAAFRGGVRRVSVCGAVAAACSTGQSWCPSTPVTCPSVSLTATTVNDAELATISAKAVRLTAGRGGVLSSAPEVCGGGVTFESTSSTLPETVCADRQYSGIGARPWIGAPQPGSNPCPAACVLALADQRLYLSLDPKFLSVDLKDAVLKLDDSYLSLDVASLLQTPEIVLEGVPVDATVSKASLVFKVEGSSEDFSTESELVIKQ